MSGIATVGEKHMTEPLRLPLNFKMFKINTHCSNCFVLPARLLVAHNIISDELHTSRYSDTVTFPSAFVQLLLMNEHDCV